MKFTVGIICLLVLAACVKGDDVVGNQNQTPFENRHSLYRKWWYPTNQSMMMTSELYFIDDTTLAASFHLGNYVLDSAIYKYYWSGDATFVCQGVGTHIMAYSDSTMKAWVNDTLPSQTGTSGIIYYRTWK
jgi:hypothetical protein